MSWDYLQVWADGPMSDEQLMEHGSDNWELVTAFSSISSRNPASMRKTAG